MSKTFKASKIEKAVDEQCAGVYDMQLVGEEAKAVVRCVNLGIDSHLEACYIEGLDSYEWENRMVGKRVLVTKLHCHVSSRSLAVLVRRLTEDEGGEGEDAGFTGPSLATCILETLEFKDVWTGEYTVESRTDGLVEPEQLKLTDSGAVRRVELEE